MSPKPQQFQVLSCSQIIVLYCSCSRSRASRVLPRIPSSSPISAVCSFRYSSVFEQDQQTQWADPVGPESPSRGRRNPGHLLSCPNAGHGAAEQSPSHNRVWEMPVPLFFDQSVPGLILVAHVKTSPMSRASHFHNMPPLTNKFLRFASPIFYSPQRQRDATFPICLLP